MRVSIAIQHHPRRAELLPRLLSRLTPRSPQVIRDPEPDARPNAWRTYRLALETTPSWATHRVIIQDDALPCDGFVRLLEEAIEAKRDSLITLCVCGRPKVAAREMMLAYARGDGWIQLRRFQWVPVIGLVWPVRLIRPALEWIDEQQWPREFVADDEIVGRVARKFREAVLATVPSLLQHDDALPSLARERTFRPDPGRAAALFKQSPGAIDWARGPR